MSLTNDKKNVLTKIGAFSSLKEEQKPPDSINSFKSVNNKKDNISYLLDVLKTVAGTEALKILIGGMFSTFIGSIEPQLKTSLKKQFNQYNSDDGVSSDFKNNGVLIPVKNIDTSSKFKVSPDSSSGDLLYNKNKPNFDKKAHDAILNSGTDISFSVMTLNYNKTTDNFKFKPNLTALPSPTISGWFNKFIDDAVIIDKKEITTNVMDAIYGSVTSTENKTVEQVKNELELDLSIQKLIDGESSLDLTSDEIDNIAKKAQELIDGVVNYDMGCGLIDVALPLISMTNLIQNISGTTDGFAIANAIENTINESTGNNKSAIDQNQSTIKDGFFVKIIQIFTITIIKSITVAPQIRALLAISKSFQNNGTVTSGNAKDDLNNYDVIVRCMIKKLITLMSEFIFNLAVSYLITLLKPTIKKITKEKTNQFVRILKSLTSKKK